jgi:predicted RNA-binding Zn-ribbon protein involved in translation (DUF1610 family)
MLTHGQANSQEGREMAIRPAQLIAEAVSVNCPHCGACQPNQEGSEMWTPEDFNKKHGILHCISCDKHISIEKRSTAQFH